MATTCDLSSSVCWNLCSRLRFTFFLPTRKRGSAPARAEQFRSARLPKPTKQICYLVPEIWTRAVNNRSNLLFWANRLSRFEWRKAAWPSSVAVRKISCCETRVLQYCHHIKERQCKFSDLKDATLIISSTLTYRLGALCFTPTQGFKKNDCLFWSPEPCRCPLHHCAPSESGCLLLRSVTRLFS